MLLLVSYAPAYSQASLLAARAQLPNDDDCSPTADIGVMPSCAQSYDEQNVQLCV